jgi:hypothetical protein
MEQKNHRNAGARLILQMREYNFNENISFLKQKTIGYN